MINIDRILGGLVQSVVSSALSQVVSRGAARNAGFKMGRAAARVDKNALGVGAQGLAVAAFEHFSESNRHVATQTTTAGKVLSPPPQPFSVVSPPPPPPAARAHIPPGPSGASENAGMEGSLDALLLLRVMIAAASVDGVIDRDEQKAILTSLTTAGLSHTEREFIETELTHPKPVESLITTPLTSELAVQVYMVAHLAINEDEDAEKAFMRKLQALLHLDDEVVNGVRRSIA